MISYCWHSSEFKEMYRVLQFRPLLYGLSEPHRHSQA